MTSSEQAELDRFRELVRRDYREAYGHEMPERRELTVWEIIKLILPW
jgi:hypothetical protein